LRRGKAQRDVDAVTYAAHKLDMCVVWCHQRADLYHLDHFLGGFKTACGALVDCQSFTILEGPPESPDKPITPLSEGMEAVYVAVTDSKGGGGGVFELRLVQRGFGLKAGCWMTKSCLKVK
jgi:hypothetical protein